LRADVLLDHTNFLMSTRLHGAHASARHHPAHLGLRPWPLAALLALSTHGPLAHATDVPSSPEESPRKTKTLSAVQVGAADTALPLDPNLPTPVHTLDAAQIAQINPINVEDTLKYVPAFGIRKRFIGDENSTFSVRGTSNQQSARGLVYLDGLLLSNLLNNTWSTPPRWSMVPQDNLARVDVLYGAYSALYPGNAIGATVLMTTRMPQTLELSAQTQLFTQHVSMYGVDRNYGGSRNSASLGDRVGKLAFLLDVTHLQSNGQPLVFATQNLSRTPASASAIPVSGATTDRDPTGAPRAVLGINSEGQEATSQNELNLKTTYDFTPTLQGGFTFGYWDQELSHRTGGFLRNAAGQPVSAGTVAIDGMQYALPANLFAPGTRKSENQLYGLALGTHRASGWNVQAQASYFDLARNQDRLSDNALQDDGPGQLTRGDGSRWRTLDLRASYRPDSLTPGSHWLSFGYHYDGYRLDNPVYAVDAWQGGVLGAPISATGGSTQTQALYLQDAWQLSERWQFVYGVRREQWRAFYGFIETTNGGVITDAPLASRQEAHNSPKASLVFDINDAWRLRLSGARAYRFPTVGELFQGTFSGIQLINNNPYLKPENDLSRELDAEWDTAHGLTRFSLYRSDTRNTLLSQTDYTVFPNVTNVQNIARVRTRGAEASYDGKGVLWDRLDLSANAAYTQATTLSDPQNPGAEGKQFYRVPRWRANALATWHSSDNTALTLAGRYSGRQYNTLDHSDSDPNTFGGASAFLTWDASFHWKLDAHWELNLGVDNLTDRRYYVYYPYPARTYSLQAKVHL
jgi:iron complex outermembrane receptor protein